MVVDSQRARIGVKRKLDFCWRRTFVCRLVRPSRSRYLIRQLHRMGFQLARFFVWHPQHHGGHQHDLGNRVLHSAGHQWLLRLDHFLSVPSWSRHPERSIQRVLRGPGEHHWRHLCVQQQYTRWLLQRALRVLLLLLHNVRPL